MSPEIVKRTDDYNECVDWWSLGVVTFELLTGCSPFTVDGSQNSSQDIARRILNKAVPYPKFIDDTSRYFMDGLLTKDPRNRLGAHGVEDIKSHEFFSGLNWDQLSLKKLPPPLKPNIVNCVDVNNFPPEFTNQPPVFSPADPTPRYQDIFRGYSFVSPSVIFSNDNVIGDEFLKENMKSLMKNSLFFDKYEMDTSAEGFLGRGTFSVCRKCIRLSDGRTFAVKIVSQRFAYHAMREIRILEMLNPHENIVTLIDAMSDALHYYIVLELLKGGELLQTLKKMVKFTEFHAVKIMAQLVHAVSHIHAKGIVHRDLKPENILFVDTNEDVKVRLVDFGFARVLPKEDGDSDTMVTPCCGTLFYAAPEVLEVQDELPQYNQQCDLWSLGVILFTMLSGKIPFRARNNMETAADVIQRIRNADFSFDDLVWESVDDKAKDLITSLLTVDPKKRLSLRQLALHPWLTNSDNNGSHELQTPNALPSLADETFNETMDAFIIANRDGFHLMDVDTAPLLVKRRGMKRRLEKDTTGSCSSSTGRTSNSLKSVPENAELQDELVNPSSLNSESLVSSSLPKSLLSIIPEQLNCTNSTEHITYDKHPITSSPFTTSAYSTKLDNKTEIHNATELTPKSGAFTEYRDTRPPYLKYSRDDYIERLSDSQEKRFSDSA